MNKSNEVIKSYFSWKSGECENDKNQIYFLNQWATPKEYFYIRNDFQYLELTQECFLLRIGGEVTRPKTFHYYDLLDMPSKKEVVAIKEGRWRGVPLKFLLEQTGLKDSAMEIMFIGHDYRKISGNEGLCRYATSMTIEEALDPSVIVAFEYNQKPIPYNQGHPLRLIVPMGHPMASVKWLKGIEVIDHKFKGPFQANK